VTNPWYSPETGNEVDLETPHPDSFDIYDIALGLSNTSRYAGQTDPSLNVAQHSVNVAETLQQNGATEETQLYGLLHDLGEAYLGDVPRPAKEKIQGFEHMEQVIQEAAFHGLYGEQPSEKQWNKVMEADNQQLLHEVDQLFTEKTQAEEIKSRFKDEWCKTPEQVVNQLNQPLNVEPEKSREDFINLYHELVK